MVCNLVCGVWRVPKLNMVQRKSDAHAHSWLWGRRTQQSSSHTHVGWWGSKGTFQRCRLLSMGPTLSLQSPPGSVEEWWGSNTPVTLVSLLVIIHGVDHSYQLRVFSVGVVVFMGWQVAVADGATYRRCLCRNSLLRELLRRGFVFDHEIHMNTLECSFAIHHQLQSQYRSEWIHYNVMHPMYYVRIHICICALSQWLYVCIWVDYIH